MKFANIINMHMELASPSPSTSTPTRIGQRMLIKAIILSVLICLPGTQGLREATRSMILDSTRINEKTFETQTKTQSKQTSLTAATTATKSLALILEATQITNHQTEKLVAATAPTHSNSAHSPSSSNGSFLGSNVAINNISNNGDNSTMATNVSIALEANLIMSNRNVQDEQDSIEHNATMSSTDSATSASTTTTTTTTVKPTTTTTRRPAPTTTLKPPPTIDDYQTIISQAGTHAYLPCNVKQLVKKPISWLRMRDGHILTVDQTTFIADQRFQSVFSPNPERWSLQIKYVQVKDEGTYECQVSTEPKASAIVHLRIVEPKTELIGESTRHVKAGSQVKLRCIISQALEPPLFINWFYNQKQIYLHNRRGWRTEIERIDLPTEAPTTTTIATTTRAATETSATATAAAPSTSTASASAAAEASNGLLTITRSYILDAISVIDGSDAITEINAPTTAPEADNTGNVTAATSTPTTATLISGAGATAAITTTPAATSTGWPSTTSTTAATTTTTTMVPSSSFIKQITTASLIIPAVVKLDSGNYTCSPSNSAPRTIVLHVLNGEYSASAIKSASNTLIGCRGYLQWHSVSTILTLLWIIKFAMARNMTVCTTAVTRRANTKSQEGKRIVVRYQHTTSSISGAKVVEDKT
ncbi:integumentary mucin C.1 [Drosophila tropicalis]|uniref:integumentary mucin C.1 n=1 Tax=Drosophila tropicalis TaxID=46794 RepID=UPI0035ABC8AB